MSDRFELVIDEFFLNESWASIDDAEQWLEGLIQTWVWPARRTQTVTTAMDKLGNAFNDARTAFLSVKQGKSAELPESEKQTRVLSALRNLFQTWPALAPRHPEGMFILQLKAKKAELAAHVFALSIGVPPDARDLSAVLPAYFELEVFRRKLGAATADDVAAIKGYGDEARVESASIHQLRKGVDALLDGLDDRVSKRIDEVAVGFESASDAWQDTLNSRLAEATQRLSKLEETYRADVILDAPVKHWDDKRKEHKSLITRYGIAAIVAVLCSAGILTIAVCWAGNAFDHARLIQTALDAKDLAKAKELLSADATSWHVAVGTVVILATMCLWIIRVLVRLLLSHIHLENDAAERVTMAKTYKALLGQEKGPTNDQLQIVLTALFRPSGDGIVKDEGIPPVLMEFLTRTGSKP